MRIVSLDVFRGITIAGMIIVNTPGSWETVYPPLLHAKWHGCTPTDLVFPFFLFIMGLSMSLSMKKFISGERKADSSLYLKIFKRSLLLFGIGLFLSLFPYFNFSGIRIPGVLQRIGVVFLFSSLILLNANRKMQIAITGIFLLGYWGLLTLVPVPGTGATGFEVNNNLAAWVDQQLLTGHMWKATKTWDPEGVLSTIPAICSTLIGAILGQYAFDPNSKENLWKLILVGSMMTGLGLLWSLVFPLNKSLWTSSYVLYTAGLGTISWLALYYFLDYLKLNISLLRPFRTLGLNAIASYSLSILLVKVLFAIKLSSGDSLYRTFYLFGFKSWLDPYLASFLFALIFLAFCYVPIRIMDRKGIYLKV